MNDNHIADERKPIYQARAINSVTWIDQSKDGYDHMAKYPMCFDVRIVHAAPIAPRADADTAGAKPQTDAEALYEAWTAAINTGTGMVRIEHVPRENFAAPPASSVADAAGEKGWAFRSDGKLWVTQSLAVAERWKAQGFEITPVAAGASERADAEKDAALTDAEIIEMWKNDRKGTNWRVQVLSFARAILAANKEKP